MKTVEQARVLLNEPVGPQVMRLRLAAPEIACRARPGQFVNVKVSGSLAPLLRRPFGVAGLDAKAGTFDVIYRVIGEGTKTLAEAKPGAVLSVVGPLGNGFACGGRGTLVVGGGLGLAPLLFLAQARPGCDVLMGGRTAAELYWKTLFAPYARRVHATTDDGSGGVKGTVMALLPGLLQGGAYDALAVCGPEPMMRAVAACAQEAGLTCEVSLERFMACGLGACLSCAFEGRNGRLKVCTDGPVFVSGRDLAW